MMRRLPTPPEPDFDEEYSGWEEDFVEEDYAEAEEPPPARRRDRKFSNTGGMPPSSKISGRQLPPPPTISDGSDATPPALPPRPTGRPSLGNTAVPPSRAQTLPHPPIVDDDEGDDYLEPESQQQQIQVPPSRAQTLPHPPIVDDGEGDDYLEPESQQQQIQEKEYEIPPDEQEYEIADECIGSNGQMHAPQLDMEENPEVNYAEPEEEQTYEQPDEALHYKQKIPKKMPINQPGWRPPKSIALRQLKGGLRPVNDVFSKDSRKPAQLPPSDVNDETSEDNTIKGIMKKLAKQSSMFRSGSRIAQPASRPVPPVPEVVARCESPRNYKPPREESEPPISRAQQLPQTTRPEDEEWYFDIERDEVDEKLGRTNGMFLVRPSKKGGPDALYTLCLYYNVRVFNLKIRKRSDNKYALGTPQENEKTFDTVSALIEYHRHHPIILAGKEKGSVLLVGSPSRDDIYDCTA